MKRVNLPLELLIIPPLFLPDQRLAVSLEEKAIVLSYRFYPKTKVDRTDIANIKELARTSTPLD